jgi:arabinofuranosyltransferase
VLKTLPKQARSTPLKRIHTVLLLSVAALLLYTGWREFWFITDDAYIAFRYVSNSVHGHGYVWNPEPFRAVEGYTSFLWVVILDFVWRVFGVEPPSSANVLSFIFSFGTIVVTAFAAFKARLAPQHERSHLLFAILVVVGLLVNPAFLTWASSGLETSLFNFCLLCWVVSVILVDGKRYWWLLAITTSAALTYLARPDGLLMVFGTLILVARALLEDAKNRKLTAKWFLSVIPLLVPLIHLFWRKAFYGEWLPNTYYAKQVAVWPAAGMRYLLSFVIEYGVWFWLIVMAIAAVKMLRSPSVNKTADMGKNGQSGPVRWRLAGITWNTVVVLAVLLMHFGYYTFVVGGDHFEWRVYSHLFPLLFLSLLYGIGRLDLSAVKGLLVLAVMIVLSLPIPWSYHSAEKRITYVPLASTLKLTVSDKLPFIVSPLAEVQDSLQSWLTDHLVCVRRQKHKLFYENQLRVYPERSFEVPEKCGPYPVANFSTVGVPGWVLPNVNILDGYGLNDYIVARNPVIPDKERKMAHDRIPPRMYLSSFVPNVRLEAKKDISYQARRADLELTPQRIGSIEKYWEDKIVRGVNPPDSTAPWPIPVWSDTMSILYR